MNDSSTLVQISVVVLRKPKSILCWRQKKKSKHRRNRRNDIRVKYVPKKGAGGRASEGWGALDPHDIGKTNECGVDHGFVEI